MQLSTLTTSNKQHFHSIDDGVDQRYLLSTARRSLDVYFSLDDYKKEQTRRLTKFSGYFSTYTPKELIDMEQMTPSPLSAETIIDTVKQVTGLSVKDLAGIFQVTRQTLYNFRHSEGKISERNWERLQAVSHEVESISAILTSSPGSLMKRITLDEQTLYELLCADALNSAHIKKLAREVAKHLKQPQSSVDQHSVTIEQLTRHA